MNVTRWLQLSPQGLLMSLSFLPFSLSLENGKCSFVHSISEISYNVHAYVMYIKAQTRFHLTCVYMYNEV